MNDTIKKQIELKAPVSRVWRALTDYREFGEWFRVKLDGPFEPGKVSRGRITYPGYEHLQWEAVDYSNEPATLVEFRLEPKDGGTVLFLTESGFDAIPKERQFEAFRMNDGGWSEQMTNIERHVQGSA